MYVINDQHKTVESIFSFQLLTLDGDVLKQKSFELRIEMSSSQCVFSMDKKEFLQDKTLSELFLHAEISADNEIICDNHYFFVKPIKKIGIFFWKKIDVHTIDKFGPDGISSLIKFFSNKVVKFQSGYIYQYAFIMLLGFSALLTYLIVNQ